MSETSKDKKPFKFKGERTAATLSIGISAVIFLFSMLYQVTFIYVFILALVCARATYELIKAVGCKNILLLATSCVGSFAYIIIQGFGINVILPSFVISLYVLLILSMSVSQYNKGVKFNDCLVAIFASLVITYSFSCFLNLYAISEIIPSFTHREGTALVYFALTCSWATDSYAFLVGRKLGKHKMSPSISPNKSIEGAIGGVVLTVISNIIFMLCFSAVCTATTGSALFMDSIMKYVYLTAITLVLSCWSMVGDLSASAFKRSLGIKDFSNLLPGHGGMVDRFDSSLFVLPVMYGIFQVLALCLN